LKTKSRTNAPSSPSLEPIFRRTSWRVVPLLVLLYLIAFLDRVNVGFASLTMNRDLGITESAYGFAAGVFFAGYLVFSVPSSLMLARLGAPRWIGAIMVVWGIASSTQALVHGPASYTLARFLIGAAEAGFFPGIILYLSTWLPRSRRTGVMGLFTVSIPLATIIGAPVSTHLMQLDGLFGLRGWQWLFLLEGLPAVLLGLVVPRLLASGPQRVPWLSLEEKTHLLNAIALEDSAQPRSPTPTHVGFSSMVRIAGLSAATYFLLMVGLYTLSFWIPRILQVTGMPLLQIGWITALIYAIGGTALVVLSRFADKSSSPHRHLLAAFTLASVGFLLAATGAKLVAELGLILAASGILAGMPIFWGSAPLGDEKQRPIIIASINAVGNLGGLIGPYIVGLLVTKSHSFSLGLLATAAMSTLGIVLCAVLKRAPQR